MTREGWEALFDAAADLVDLTERWNNEDWGNAQEYAELEARAYSHLIAALKRMGWNSKYEAVRS